MGIVKLGRTGRSCLGLAMLGGFMCIFEYVPAVLRFENLTSILWIGLYQVLALAVCVAMSVIAWRRGGSSYRTAWKFFTAGYALYLAGNVYYFYGMNNGFVPAFPSIPDFTFFLMAIAAAVGMSRYGTATMEVKQSSFYNFVMSYCAIAVACFVSLQNEILGSQLHRFGTTMAFLYPALWISVAIYGAISLLTFNRGRMTFPFLLMVAGVSCEAVGDFRYASMLLTNTYVQGGYTQFFWTLSIGFSIWAAIEHFLCSRAVKQACHTKPRLIYDRVALASMPGLAIAIIVVSVAYGGGFGRDPLFISFAVASGLGFAALSGMREHSIISRLKNLRLETEEGKRRLNTALESTSDSVVVLDRHWRITYANSSAVRILSDSGSLGDGIRLWAEEVCGGRFPERTQLEEAMRSGDEVEFEAPFTSDDMWLGVRAFPATEGMTIFFRDISERRKARIEIETLALKDPLTSLANRAAFHRSLASSLKKTSKVGILLLDLDHFKEINDTKGHPVGDEVIREVARRLSLAAEGSVVARLGGDEFAIIVEGHTEATAGTLAARIIDILSKPITVNGDELGIGSSIGIALWSTRADGDVLLRNADIALYEVKNSGRNGYAFFRRAMETLLLERNGMKQDLAKALENDEFELYFQPLVDLQTGKVSSCEALLRWNHPERGLMPPDTFIPLIEESGLIVPIGAWVMRTACRQAMLWPADVAVAVNISTRQFGDPSLLNNIRLALDDSGMPASRLELEITESALLNDSGENLALLSQIRAMGIKIALDDFGTGYSSLGYLHKFKFDKLKIDKSFVQDLNVKDESEAIVRSVVTLGRSLGMAITAEGVETKDQYAWLQKECQHAQGHFISRPINGTKTVIFLSDGEALAEKIAGATNANQPILESA